MTWDLPVSIKMVRDLGDRGVDVQDVACDLTWKTGIMSAAIVVNEIRCLTEVTQPKTLDKTSTPTLTLEPVADCSRYDDLRSVCHVH